MTVKFQDNFSGVPVPQLFLDYDCIGFDTCMVTFTHKMTQLLIETYLRDLMENFKYPLEIMQVDFEAKKDNMFIDSTSVWDIEHGNLLVLTAGTVVSEAYNGFKTLTQ